MKNWILVLTVANAKQDSAAEKIEKLQLERSQEKARRLCVSQIVHAKGGGSHKGKGQNRNQKGNGKGQTKTRAARARARTRTSPRAQITALNLSSVATARSISRRKRDHTKCASSSRGTSVPILPRAAGNTLAWAVAQQTFCMTAVTASTTSYESQT